MISRLRAVLERRGILRLLVQRDLKVKYSDSTLGYLWSVLEPLSMVAVYWFVFTQVFTRVAGADPYILFLICGLLPWQAISGAMNASTRALTMDKKLVRSTNLPREVWILRSVGSRMTELVLTLPVVVLFAVIYHDQVDVSWFLLLTPVVFLVQAVLLVGLSLVLAPVSVLFSDLDRLMRVIIRLLFYASPVLYGVEDVPSAIKIVYTLNPIAGILETYRAVFFPEMFPGWGTAGIAVLISFGLLFFGMWVFGRLEHRVLKEI